MIEQFAKQRSYFLRAALMEAMKWSEPPEQLVEGKRSDQFWLRAFSFPSGPVTARTVRNFLIAYRLVRQGQWNDQAIAARIENSRELDDSDIPKVVREFAGFLSTSVSRVRGGNRQQTSAGSKFAFFMKPLCEVYIWDQLATVSARFREWRRAGEGRRPRSFGRAYASANGEHDYALYRAACARSLAEERSCDDFVVAVDKFRAFLQDVGGPMGSEPIVSSSFVERRYLDKLMWFEGIWIKAWKKYKADLAA
jgi:hypothetical protein